MVDPSAATPFLDDEPQLCQPCILSGHFRSPRDQRIWKLCLTPTALTCARDSLHKIKALVLRLEDVVGAKATPAVGSLQAGRGEGLQSRLEVFAYVPGNGVKEAGCAGGGGPCRKKRRKAAHQTWLTSDPETAETWATVINDRLTSSGGARETDGDGEGSRAGSGPGGGDGGDGGGKREGVTTGPGRRLLVLINPVSGTGSSRRNWDNILRPMLEQAQATVTAIFSTRRGELAELITSAGNTGGSRVGSLDDLDGIIVVGGDGTFFEVLQGMYARPDCAEQLARLPLGIVPSGSGNGLAKTVSVEAGEEFGAMSASFLAARGATRAMDLLRTESGNKKYLAFLNVGWGMISDVDIESEAYRFVGSARFTIGTVVRIVNLKHYEGRISYLPAPAALETAAAAAAADASSLSSPSASHAFNTTAPSTQFRMPPLTEPLPPLAGGDADSGGAADASAERWTSVEGGFVLASVPQTSHISHDMPMAPHSRLGDGLMDLFFIKKGASRIAMMQMFLAMEKGEHISPRYPCISWFRVRAFRIEPSTSKGRLTVDGELVDYAPLQQHVWHNAAKVFCSPDRQPR